MKNNLAFKVGVSETTEVMIESSLGLLTSFAQKFSPISNSPAAVASLIQFYSDPVFVQLLGKDQSAECVSIFKAFSRNNKSISSVSFASLVKWVNRSSYRAGNPFKRSYSSGKAGASTATGSGASGSGQKKSRF